MMSYVMHTQCVFVLQAGTGCGKRQRYRSECPFATSTLTLIGGCMNKVGWIYTLRNMGEHFSERLFDEPALAQRIDMLIVRSAGRGPT